jgi:hypothetical protein
MILIRESLKTNEGPMGSNKKSPCESTFVVFPLYQFIVLVVAFSFAAGLRYNAATTILSCWGATEEALKALSHTL